MVAVVAPSAAAPSAAAPSAVAVAAVDGLLVVHSAAV